ncbi:MAG: diaminopimelate epimerase [Desulfitobacteriaceae bacterium]|nr:diaminopimelate epimerase [Desulfitobacteriaceae bacterium]MDD4345664.1 diaminopimelate epimerase [Desulfitobacteriaceae bacterium]MDD4400524.1 diaminopimelate epimerase [Desulfitobacteriaceae bacterium]
MKFWKMHGLGNDFVFLDQFSMAAGDFNYPELARQLCHRQFGVGGDGLILVLPSSVADARMRVFNPDGSEPEMCGNGIRCFARFVYERGYAKTNPLTAETLSGILSLQLILDADKVSAVRVDMGEPVLKPQDIPVNVLLEPVLEASLEIAGLNLQYSAVSMGNPHCIIFRQDFSTLDLERLGPAIEEHPLFPNKTNVEFIRVDSPGEITMQVWERGTGLTLACGTGACAAVVASVLNGLTERSVTVHLPGGDLQIEWAENNHLYMTGPAVYTFRGVLL